MRNALDEFRIFYEDIPAKWEKAKKYKVVLGGRVRVRHTDSWIHRRYVAIRKRFKRRPKRTNP